MKAILVFFLALIVFCGCGCSTGERCIKVSGSYMGADGEFEYCWKKGDSEKLGNLTFERSDGKKVITIDEEQARRINQLVAQNQKKEDAVAASSDNRHPFEILLESVSTSQKSK